MLMAASTLPHWEPPKLKGAGNYKRTNLSNATVGAALAAMYLSFAAKAAPKAFANGISVISFSLSATIVYSEYILNTF